jgi:hypothetical protein
MDSSSTQPTTDRLEAAAQNTAGMTITDFVALCRDGYCPTLQTEARKGRMSRETRQRLEDARIVAAALDALGLPWMARMVAC